MSETYSEIIVVGTISPLQAGTRLRVESNTYSGVRGSYGESDVVMIDHIRTCLVSTDRDAVDVGDQWARVVSINGVTMPMPSWMAIKYHGVPVCSESWTEQGGDPTPPTEPTTDDDINVEVDRTSGTTTVKVDGVEYEEKP